jgi:hypothetical protein
VEEVHADGERMPAHLPENTQKIPVAAAGLDGPESLPQARSDLLQDFPDDTLSRKEPEMPALSFQEIRVG